jgi:hypothetical protein
MWRPETVGCQCQLCYESNNSAIPVPPSPDQGSHVNLAENKVITNKTIGYQLPEYCVRATGSAAPFSGYRKWLKTARTDWFVVSTTQLCAGCGSGGGRCGFSSPSLGRRVRCARCNQAVLVACAIGPTREPLQSGLGSGADDGVANPRDTTQYRCGLRLASAPDDDLLGRVQLPFLR